MTLKRNNFNGGTDGVTITAANSSTSGDAFSSVVQQGAGDGKYAITSKIRGTQGARVTGTAAASDTFQMLLQDTAATQAAIQCYFRLRAVPTAAATFIRFRSTTATVGGQFIIDTSGRLVLQHSGGIAVKTFNGGVAISLNTIYRVDMQTDITAGTLAAQWYDDNDTLLDSQAAVSTTVGATNPYQGHFGKLTAGSDNFDFDFDEVAFNGGTTTPISPVAKPPDDWTYRRFVRIG